MTEWELRHLADVDPARPPSAADTAYRAMAALIADRWLDVTRFEREQHVHGGRDCGAHVCDVCMATSLRSARTATDQLHRHLRRGQAAAGTGPRDWSTMARWVRTPDLSRTPVATVRAGLYRGLPDDHPVLPLVRAVAAQLLPSQPRPDGVRGIRRMQDAVAELRRGVRAHERRWDPCPERDLAENPGLVATGARHPRGLAVLDAVLRALSVGDPAPYRTVLSGAGASPGDEHALRAFIGDLLDVPATADWFLRNVDSRLTYNQDQVLLQFRSASEESEKI